MARANTTASAAIGINDTSILVASATSVAAGRVIWCEREQMVVLSSYVSGTTVPVQRGVNSVTSTHPSGALITHGLPSDFGPMAATESQGFLANWPTMTGRLPVIAGSGATVTLTEAQSGSTVLFDRAAGIVYTLPAPQPGLYFDFEVLTTVTSNAHKVITDAAASFLVGSVVSIDTDSGNVTVGFTADGTTIRAISQNGTTTGGLKGTTFRIKALSSTIWMISGIEQGNGTVATPFATS
jgi:hypothetical protein